MGDGDVEDVFASEPGLIQKIVLRVADPGGGEDFRHAVNAGGLTVRALEKPGHDDVPVRSGDEVGANRVMPLIAFAARLIIAGGPEDIARGGVRAFRVVLQE